MTSSTGAIVTDVLELLTREPTQTASSGAPVQMLMALSAIAAWSPTRCSLTLTYGTVSRYEPVCGDYTS